VAVATLLLAACGSSGTTSGGSTSTSHAASTSAAPAAGTAALGTPDQATGTPVKIGLISDGGSGAIGTAPLVEQGAKMAVAYANAYRGGVVGHPISLVICENQETPAGGQACANQMVADHVVAITVPFTGQGAAEVPTIVRAGVPYITLSGASAQELSTPGAFDLTGGFPATLGAFALSAKHQGYSKFAMLVSNVPAAIQGAQLLGSVVFKAAGIGFKVIPVNPGTPDVTPQMQAAVSWGAKAIGLAGDVTLCSSFLKGYQTLGLTQAKYVTSTCLDPSILSTLGTELGGSYIATFSPGGGSDQALYAAITKKYAPSVNANPNVSANQAGGAIPVLAFLNLMHGYSGPVTSAGVLRRVKTGKNVAIPLSGGIAFTCDGAAIPILPSVCSAVVKVGKVSSTGVISGLQSYNSATLFHP
jgi:branched-chain amino acid transport system substrate-binding protein